MQLCSFTPLLLARDVKDTFIIMNPSLTAKTFTLLESPKLAVHEKDIATYPFHFL